MHVLAKRCGGMQSATASQASARWQLAGASTRLDHSHSPATLTFFHGRTNEDEEIGEDARLHLIALDGSFRRSLARCGARTRRRLGCTWQASNHFSFLPFCSVDHPLSLGNRRWCWSPDPLELKLSQRTDMARFRLGEFLGKVCMREGDGLEKLPHG